MLFLKFDKLPNVPILNQFILTLVKTNTMDQDNTGLFVIFEDYIAQLFDEDYCQYLADNDPEGYKFLLEQFKSTYTI
jgi:hypothetical protein